MQKRWFALLLAVCLSCEKEFSPQLVDQKVSIPFAIVSVQQNTSTANAVISVKFPSSQEDFQLTLKNAAGGEIALTSGTNESTAGFSLRQFTASGLAAEQTYKAELSFKNEQGTPVTVSRAFSSTLSPSWTKLAETPIVSGDFTGAAALSIAINSRVVVFRYRDATRWDILRFDGKWESTESKIPIPRHSAIAFPLSRLGDNEQYFMGFGYVSDEKLPGKKSYLNDFWWSASYFSVGQQAGIVFPSFEGIEKEVKFFTIGDKAFMLKENDTGEMWAMDYTWDRSDRKSFPENTGRLVCFTANGLGYVINQTGNSVHLYSYDPSKDTWTRKADFPGTVRDLGSGFSAAGNGYYGSGVDINGNGLRDFWEYNVKQNAWRYHSEYPGQGHRYLIALSDANRAFIGWGYETRALQGDAKELVGCTDFWEFKP